MTTNNVSTSSEIIRNIRLSYEFHLSEANRFKRFLESADSMSEYTLMNPKRQTLKNRVINILSDGIPRTTHELTKEYEIIVGDKIEQRHLAARLSNASASSEIKNYSIKSNPRNIRYWWVLDKWIENGKLKDIYMDKIKEKIKG